MRINIGGVLVTLFAGIDVVAVVSSTSLDVEQQTVTPSNGSMIGNPDIIKDPDPDGDHPPIVGIRNFQSICPSSNNSTGGEGDGDDTHHSRGCAVRERLVSAMESDYRLKGKMGAFVCIHTACVTQQMDVQYCTFETSEFRGREKIQCVGESL